MTGKEQPKNGNKHPRPSYEEGELRDKSIEEKSYYAFRGETPRQLIRKAVKKR